MENYKIGVQGKNKQGSKSFYIEVSLEPKNFPGGFRQWIGNSNNKVAISAWLKNQCAGYEFDEVRVTNYFLLT